MSQRTHLLATAALALLLFSGCGPDGPGADTARDADWCNLLLVPSLAAHLELDLPTRIHLAARGADLLRSLRGGTPWSQVMSGANAVTDQLGVGMVEQAGRETRDSLSPRTRQSFQALLRAGLLVPVRFWTEKGRRGAGDRLFVTYGWVAEEEARKDAKALRALERELDNAHEWIAGEQEAALLVEANDEDVQRAARRVLNPRPPPMSAEERTRRNAEAHAFAEQSKSQQQERKARYQAKLRERALEREARQQAFEKRKAEFARRREERERARR